MQRRRFLKAGAAVWLLGACAVDDDGREAADAGDAVGGGGETKSGSISQPLGSIVTRWGLDRFSLGSYSYLAVGSSSADRVSLAASVDDRLYFAGEAASVEYPATVHGAILSGRETADEITSTHGSDVEVVIIGAGAAGLAAGERLQAHGASVTIVEGRGRIGGRVHTDTSLGVPVELGAGWIHGDDGNPLTDLAERFGVERLVSDTENIKIYDAEGEEVDTGALEEVQDALSSIADGFDGDNTDLGEIIDDALEDLDGTDLRLARYVIATVVEHDEATDYGTLSTETFEVGEEFDGDDVVVPTGYIDLLSPLADDLDIVLDTAVTYVGYGDRDVVVEFEDGGSMDADVVIVTVPLGVLKAGSIEFEPALPGDKSDAIERLGMGVLDRIVLSYDKVFWDDDAVLIGHVAEEPGYFVEWQNLSAATGQPIISGFNAGSVAARIEALSDEEATAAATSVLETIYGQ